MLHLKKCISKQSKNEQNNPEPNIVSSFLPNVIF